MKVFSGAVMAVATLLKYLFSPLPSAQEYAADAYAVRLGHSLPLQQALTALHIENLSSFAVDPLFSA